MCEKLIKYRVYLKDSPEDKFMITFDCWAEDEDHSVEQAENAYPEAYVIIAHKLEE